MARIAMIAAVSDNGFIGKDNKLPWHVEGDLQFFKRQTLGKPIIMGRKSFQSLGKPLPGRTNIVLTRDASFQAPANVLVFSDLKEAIETASSIAKRDGADEIMIGGGEEIYRIAMPLADRMYLTEIHCAVDGDTRFPPFDGKDWAVTSRVEHPAGPRDSAAFSIVTWDRKQG